MKMIFKCLPLVIMIFIISACSCEECFTQTLSPDQINEVKTAQFVQLRQIPLSDTKPNLFCLVDFDSAEMEIIGFLMEDSNQEFGDRVAISQLNIAVQDILNRYEDLQITQYPVCLIFDKNRQEVFRTHNNFEFDTFEPILTDLLDNP